MDDGMVLAGISGCSAAAKGPAAVLMDQQDDDFFMDLKDTLFTSLNQRGGFAFPDPKEMCKCDSDIYVGRGSEVVNVKDKE